MRHILFWNIFFILVVIAGGKHHTGYASTFPTNHIWDAKVSPYPTIPPRVIAVNKNRQEIYVLENQGKLQTTLNFLCSTGQVPGDKIVEGDLKTPEGVYFVVQHVTGGLDFDMYGNEAYTLNYPNPVDKLRKKTGYGIWIHGRGPGIAPLQTQGCIALANSDLTSLGRVISRGFPVILSSTVQANTTLTPANAQKAAMLEKLVTSWAKAWSERSQKLYDYYDGESYSLATESFHNFKANKEKLFKRLDWITIDVENIQVLEGPGYWVTWFSQDYKAPNLQTKGVRRLYWMEKPNGDFKIVGMEWLPGMTTDTTIASIEPAMPAIIPNPQTETAHDNIDIIAANTSSAIQNTSTPTEHGAVLGASVVAPKAPSSFVASSTIPEQDIIVAVTENPTTLNAIQAQKPTQTPESTQAQIITLEDSNDLLAPAVTTVSPQKPAPIDMPHQLADIQDFIIRWQSTWLRGDPEAYITFYTSEAVQGSRTSAIAILEQKKRVWTNAQPKEIILSDVQITQQGDFIVATMHQVYKDASGASDVGTKVLHIRRLGDSWYIAKETWSAL